MVIDLSTVTADDLRTIRDDIDAELRRRQRGGPAALPPGCHVYTLPTGELAVVAPFHPLLKTACWTTFAGRFQTILVTAGIQQEAWVVDRRHREAIIALMHDLLGQTLIERCITFRRDTAVDLSPTIDGFDLVELGADRHTYRMINTDVVVVVRFESHALESSGTVNYPRLRGSMTVRVRCRPNAVLDWGEGADITIED